jgi:hypothetical protein
MRVPFLEIPLLNAFETAFALPNFIHRKAINSVRHDFSSALQASAFGDTTSLPDILRYF